MRLIKYENYYINPDCVVYVKSRDTYRQEVTFTNGNTLTVQASEKSLMDALLGRHEAPVRVDSGATPGADTRRPT